MHVFHTGNELFGLGLLAERKEGLRQMMAKQRVERGELLCRF
jgi:hypothetical protein